MHLSCTRLYLITFERIFKLSSIASQFTTIPPLIILHLHTYPVKLIQPSGWQAPNFFVNVIIVMWQGQLRWWLTESYTRVWHFIVHKASRHLLCLVLIVRIIVFIVLCKTNVYLWMEEPAKHLNVSLPISLSQKSQLYRLGRMQFTRLGSSLTAKSKSFVLDTIWLSTLWLPNMSPPSTSNGSLALYGNTVVQLFINLPVD